MPLLEDSVIKRRSMLDRFGALSIGLSAACLALACGSENDPPPSDEGPPAEVIPPDECVVNPYLEDCREDPEPSNGGTGNTPTPPDPVPPEPPPETDLQTAQVENILKAECGACHGTQLTELTARAGMNYINDMEQLVENGKVLPLDAENSPIIKRMRSGTMPPPSEGYDRVATAQIDIVANYIDNADNFPGLEPTVCNDNPPADFDELYSDVVRDLQDQDNEDQPFIRYVSLRNTVASGVCTDTSLDLDRQALIKMVNMLSIDATVARPEAVDSDQTLYRIDLRDMKWDREIDVNGETFADVWEAIVAANQYAIPFVGDDADDARADAETDVPVMFLDSMLDVATIGNLYYAIIDVDVAQSLDVFVSDVLQIDVQANLDNEDLIRAGTTKSRISRQDRLIEGHEIEARAGVYYQSFDFADDQNESIFQDPFGFNEGGREAIFTLPNGMLAYLIADEDGNLVEDSDILLDTSQGNFRAVTSVSCSNCHASGFIPVKDEVRPQVESNALVLIQDGTLNQEQLEQLKEVYLEPDAFARRIENDSNAFYLAALRSAALPVSGVEPVSRSFIRFDRDMTLKVAASDLGLGEEELSDVLDLLDPTLTVLDGGTIDRDDFTAQYLESLCILTIANDNQVDPLVCADVLDD